MEKKVIFLIYFVLGIFESLIALRFLFLLFNARAEHPFTKWLYQTSYPLVRGFIAIFPAPAGINYTIELGSLLAILFYALLAYFLAEVVSYIASRY